MSVTISGSGQIIKQVVQTVLTNAVTGSSAVPTFIDITGLSATITPTSASNKILVRLDSWVSVSSSAYGTLGRLVRDSTPIALGDARGSSTRGTFGTQYQNSPSYASFFGGQFMDSPATTSAVTYKVQWCMEGSGTSTIGGCYGTSASYMSSTPTVLTLMEVAYA